MLSISQQSTVQCETIILESTCGMLASHMFKHDSNTKTTQYYQKYLSDFYDTFKMIETEVKQRIKMYSERRNVNLFGTCCSRNRN